MPFVGLKLRKHTVAYCNGSRAELFGHRQGEGARSVATISNAPWM